LYPKLDFYFKSFAKFVPFFIASSPDAIEGITHQFGKHGEWKISQYISWSWLTIALVDGILLSFPPSSLYWPTQRQKPASRRLDATTELDRGAVKSIIQIVGTRLKDSMRWWYCYWNLSVA
jgi:hypothetical protein